MIVIRPHAGCVNVVCFSPDGSRFASGAKDGWAKVWNPAEFHAGKPVWEANTEAEDDGTEWNDVWLHAVGLSHAQFTPNGKLLITGGRHRHVRAWDAKTGKMKWNLRKPRGDGGVGTLVVSRGGEHVAFAGGYLHTPARVYVLDSKTHKVKTFRGHDDACGALAAGPEGLASGGADRHVKFWSWKSGKCYHDLALRGYVRGLMFSPDGSRLAASGGTVVMVWDMLPPERKNSRRKPGQLREFCGHTDQVQCIDFSPDGKTIASTAHDGTVCIWDAASGEEIRAFTPNVGKLHHVAFAPDGLTLAFTSERGHVGLLDLDS